MKAFSAPVTIRTAGVSDAAAMEKLQKANFSHGATQDMLLRQLAEVRSTVFVAEYAAEIVGFADFSSVLDEGYIGSVVVREDFRRRGIGWALLAALIEDARGRELSFLSLEVRRDNLPAITLYESAGFRRVGVRKGYYSCPTEDALLMTLFFTR